MVDESRDVYQEFIQFELYFEWGGSKHIPQSEDDSYYYTSDPTHKVIA